MSYIFLLAVGGGEKERYQVLVFLFLYSLVYCLFVGFFVIFLDRECVDFGGLIVIVVLQDGEFRQEQLVVFKCFMKDWNLFLN